MTCLISASEVSSARREATMSDDRLAVVRHWIGGSRRWLETFLTNVESQPSIVSVVVMGSVVRHQGHRRSDFDLLVLYRGKRPRLDAPVEVDVRFSSVEQVDEHVSDGREILCWAVKFGTALYDPEGFWRRLQDSWRNRVPLPSAKEADDRGRQSLARAIEMLDSGDESAADDLILAAITQFIRKRLIDNSVFPASRPELPMQLRELDPSDSLADLLDEAMHGTSAPSDLVSRLREVVHDDRHADGEK